MAGVTRPVLPGVATGMLSLEDLRAEADAGTIDTVVAAFTEGRLLGKRINVSFFVKDVTEHEIEGSTTCSHLTWRWIRCPASRLRTGRRAMEISRTVSGP